jgi:hypothetical protein
MADASLVGQRFGKLVVLERSGSKAKGALWSCRCDCGTVKTVRTGHLRATSTCGCSRRKAQAPAPNVVAAPPPKPVRVLPTLIGQRFGKLVVVAHVGSTKAGDRTWECKCDCGVTKTVVGKHLKQGHTKSCGCARPKRGAAPERTAVARSRTPKLTVPGGDRLPHPVTIMDATGKVLRTIQVRPRGAAGPVGRPPMLVPGATQVGRMLDELTLQWEERTAQVA